MGLYDTIRGEYRCDECRKIISVEEQTKDFERLLKDYYPGDYLDDLKAKFYYHFSSRCPYCGFDHDICIAVQSGQYLLLLCHYPIAEWNGYFHGSYHIYGHIHASRNEAYDFMKTKERALNAGCMINHYMPASLEELIRNNREFQSNTEA